VQICACRPYSGGPCHFASDAVLALKCCQSTLIAGGATPDFANELLAHGTGRHTCTSASRGRPFIVIDVALVDPAQG
jgi:hypothetical protein